MGAKNMFKSLVSAGRGSATKRKHARNKSSVDVTPTYRSEQEEAADRRGRAMQNAASEVYQHRFPEEEDGLEEKLMRHKAGEAFKYAVIATPPPTDRLLMLNRLRAPVLASDVQVFSLDNLPPIDLTDSYNDFNLAQALTVGKKFRPLPYTLITDVLVHYVPLDTMFAVSSPITMQINDYRKITDQVARQYVLSDKGAYNILFSLDFSVRTQDLANLALTLACNNRSFKKHQCWGTMKVVIRMQHLDFPQKSNLQETMGVSVWSHSDLEDFVSNPATQSGLLSGEAMKLLKQAYQRGEVEDVVTPRDNKKKINAARTIVGGSGSNVNVGLLMDAMRSTVTESQVVKQAKFNPVHEDIEARDPNSIPPKVIRSAMKKNPMQEGRAMIAHDEDQVSVSNMSDLRDVSADESRSVSGSNHDSQDHQPNPARLSQLSGYQSPGIEEDLVSV